MSHFLLRTSLAHVVVGQYLVRYKCLLFHVWFLCTYGRAVCLHWIWLCVGDRCRNIWSVGVTVGVLAMERTQVFVWFYKFQWDVICTENGKCWAVCQQAKHIKMWIEWRNLSFSTQTKLLSLKLWKYVKFYLGHFRAFWGTVWTWAVVRQFCVSSAEWGVGEPCEHVPSIGASDSTTMPFESNNRWWDKGLQVKVKVKQSRYRPGVAQRVPGS